MNQRLPVILIAVCAAGFVAGILWLFNLRFEAGDVYPPYSSLRADPLGTMALYESLEKLPDLNVRRDFTTANRLPSEQKTTYLHLAGSPYDWDRMPEEFAREIERFLTEGGRVVIAFEPLHGKPVISPRLGDENRDRENGEPDKKDSTKERKPHPKSTPKRSEKKKKPEPSVNEASNTNSFSIRKNWGLDFRYDSLEKGFHDVYEPAVVHNQTGLPLPDSLEWHSSVVFTNLNPVWRTIYSRGTNAVVIERQFGRGSIAMATDSYFLSNEAMWKDRHTDLLAWLIGTGRNIVFDEAHFGIMESSGVAVLMRKYRLHGLMAGLLLLAVLFIWKNSTSLVPPHAEEQQRGFVAGKDAASGFVNLLRRNVPANDLLKTCFAEWKKSFPQASPHATARVQQVQSLLDEENTKSWRERDPVATYRQICTVLDRHKPPQTTQTKLKTTNENECET